MYWSCYGPRWRHNDPRFSEDVPGNGYRPTPRMRAGRWTGGWFDRILLVIWNLKRLE